MFINLHNHTSFSILDGIAKIEELVLRAKELGQSAIAITDHGSTSGLYEAQKYGDKHGIKIILGSEFYFDSEEGTGHLILLAKNNNGLKNLFKLQEYAYIKNFYKKARIDFNILNELYSDLICSSACLANPINKCIMQGNIPKAKEYIHKFKNIFKEDFYLEIMPNEIPEQVNVNKTLVRLSKEFNIPIIITNDTHYVFKEDAYAHEVVLAMQTKKKMSDEKRFRFDGDTYYLKSEKEIREELNYVNIEDINRGINNTTIISDNCNARIERGNYLPAFPIEKNTEENELKELTYKRYKEEIIDKGLHTDKFISDVENELNIICEEGYAGYFLIVQEYVNWARNNGIIVGDGRGSGAGCKVGFVNRIHRINPDQHNLLFERFMAKGREPDK